MRLAHLALPVRDQARSRRFYESYFGFDAGPAQEQAGGVLFIRDRDGFDLGLSPNGPGPGALPDFLHFGFRLGTPVEVRALADRLAADGVPLVEAWDEPGYVSRKCLDPDGYTVEIYWEIPR